MAEIEEIPMNQDDSVEENSSNNKIEENATASVETKAENANIDDVVENEDEEPVVVEHSDAADSKSAQEAEDVATALEKIIDAPEIPETLLNQWKQIQEEHKSLIPVQSESPDSQLAKVILEPGDESRSCPAPLDRVYVHVVGKVYEGKTFMEFSHEEYDFQPGKGETAIGLQMAMTGMKLGERSLIFCGQDFGFSDYRRPKDIPKDHVLVFDVKLLWFEKEKSLQQMTRDEQIAYMESRKVLGNQKYEEKKYATACSHYEKGIMAYDGGLKDLKDEKQKEQVDSIIKLLYNNMAMSKLCLKDWNGAISFSSKVLLLDKKDVKALFRRGRAYLERRDHEEALADLQMALSLTTEPASRQKMENLMERAKLGMVQDEKLQTAFAQRMMENLRKSEPVTLKEEASHKISRCGQLLRAPWKIFPMLVSFCKNYGRKTKSS